MRRLCAAFAALFVLLILSEARGDVAPFGWFRRQDRFDRRFQPRPEAPTEQKPAPARIEKTSLVVEIDNRARIPRLQIPRSLLRSAGGEAKRSGAGAPAPGQGVDDGPRRLPTLVAGLALALAFASGGLWLLRRRGTRVAVGLGTVLGLLILGGAALWADVPALPFSAPPPVQPAPAANLPQVVLPAGILLPNTLNVEVVEKGEALKLIVSRNMVLRNAGVRPPQAPGNPPAPGEE